MGRKFFWFLVIVAASALLIFATHPTSPVWRSLPWPSGTYEDPNIIERTTP